MSLKPKPRLQFADWLAAERAADQGRRIRARPEASRAPTELPRGSGPGHPSNLLETRI